LCPPRKWATHDWPRPFAHGRVRRVAPLRRPRAHDLAIPARQLASTLGGNMRRYHSVAVLAASSIVAYVLLITEVSAAGGPAEQRTPDSSGLLLSLSTTGPVVNTRNPFFQSLGTN